MSKKELNIIDKLKNDVGTGFKRIIDSLIEGFGLVNEKMFLIMKFTFFSILIALFFGFVPSEFIIYSLAGTLFFFSLIIVLFHHELFNNPIKNYKRFFKNVLFMFLILVLISVLFTFNVDPDPEINASHPAKIIASSLAFLLLVMFLFQAIYLVKAGAGPKIALKSTMNFLGKFGMSAMFYVLLLVIMFALSTIPSLFGSLFIILSVIMFFSSFYIMFILLYVFWKNAKG